MPPSSDESWDIYSKQLVSAANGYPLWNPIPEPRLADTGIEIGAVGWLKHGRFFQLLNATKPEDDAVQQLYGIPAGFTPLDRSRLHIIGPEPFINQAVLASRSIHWLQAGGEAEVNAAFAPFVSGGANIQFTASDDTGAVLFLEHPAQKEFVLSKGQIVNYMRQNFDSWLEHANGPGCMFELKQDEIIFVSGTTRTTRWANLVLHGSYKAAQGSISCCVNNVGKFSLNISIADQTLANPRYNFGPPLDSNSRASKATQCIFFHYYKMKSRILWRPRPIEAAAGPHELPPGDDNAGDEGLSPATDSSNDMDVDFEEHPQSRPPYDPVDTLLEWILEHSDAEIAVATDMDLIAMFPTTGIPLDVRAGLEEAPPSIDVDEYGVGTVVVDFLLIEEEHALQQTANPVTDQFPTSLKDTGASLPKEIPQDPHLEQPNIDLSQTHGADDRDEGSEGLTKEEATRRRLATEPTAGALAGSHSDRVTSLAVSSDSKWVASSSEDGTITLWSTQDQNAVRTWDPHGDAVCDVAFSPDGQRLLSAGAEGRIMIWAVEKGDQLAILEGHTEPVHSAAWSPDGTKIASGSEDMTVRVWDAETYQPIYLLSGHDAMVTFVLFSSDGTMLASGGADSSCRLWNVDTGALRYELLGHEGIVWTAAFDPECRRIATASDDGSVRIWSTISGEELVTLKEHHGPVRTVAFSADGKQIMSGSSDSTVKVCDSYSGKRELSLDGPDCMVNSVCFSPNGEYIASASSEVRLWKTSDGTCVKTFNEHDDQVTHALFTPNGEILTSGADDGTILVRVLRDWLEE